ncbi:hypothetical protein CDL60_06690 [Roseateles noduli]|nr:hypothetical protein CDL60_06690 [Roseateles noduli]
MPRFNRSLTLWTFALLVASVLLAWPLHEARHTGQAIAELVGATTSSADRPTSDVVAVVGVVDTGVDDAFVNAFAFDDHGNADGLDGGSGAGEVKGGGCAWCLFHAQLFAASDTPFVFSFHAEASPPPLAPTCGLPTGRCVLAAHPRGPPRA